MGHGSPLQPRRKRKKTRKLNHGVVKNFPLPLKSFLVVLVGLATYAFVSRFHGIGSEEAGKSQLESLPLAVLLNDHEISSRAARFSDSKENCLSTEETLHKVEDPFSCIADTPLLINAISLEQGYRTFLEVDLPGGWGADLHLNGAEVVDLGIRMQHQGRCGADEDIPTGQMMDVIFIRVEEDRAKDYFLSIIRRWMKVVTPGGIMILHPQQGLGWVRPWTDADRLARAGATPGMWASVEEYICKEGEASVAVGNFDGGVIVLKQGMGKVRDPGGQGENPCRLNSGRLQAESEVEPGIGDTEHKGLSFRPMSFEELFLWATGDHGVPGSVEVKFGGLKALEKNVQRRVARAACMASFQWGTEVGTRQDKEPGRGGRGSEGGGEVSPRTRLRSHGKQRKGSQTGGIVGSSPVGEGRVGEVQSCLQRHLRVYPEDIRAVFALVAVSAQAGRDFGLALRARREAKVLKSESGARLWARLCRHAASSAVFG